MGSSNSRPKICQVAPSLCQPMKDEPSLLPTSPWMITDVKGTESQEKGIVGWRKTTHLPPLTGRHGGPHIVHLEPVVTSPTGSQSVCDKSIIKSHPPQPTKGWQTMALATGTDTNPAKHSRMAYKTAESEDREWRDGPVHCYSTPSLGGDCGTSDTLQIEFIREVTDNCMTGNGQSLKRGGAGHQAPLFGHIPISNPKGHMKGLLVAQMMLSHKATKKRQTRQRCFRESQGKSKKVYTSYVEGDEMERSQRVRLVSRPMQQNVFWDEFEEQNLDVRELLQPSPQLTDQNMGDMLR